jgi:hypothetical protein
LLDITPRVFDLNASRPFSASVTSVRAGVRAMSTVGAAASVALVPVPGFDARWVEAVRALGFLAVCALLLGVTKIRPEAMSRRTACAVPAGIALFAVWLPALPGGVRAVAVVGPVAVAAAVEEVVYRVQLPHAITSVLQRSFAPALAGWLGFTASQLSFALSHVAISDGFETGAALSVVLRLLGAGMFLASVQLVAGLPVTIAMHTLANLNLATGRPLPGPLAPRAAILALCVLGALQLMTSLRIARTQELA